MIKDVDNITIYVTGTKGWIKNDRCNFRCRKGSQALIHSDGSKCWSKKNIPGWDRVMEPI